MFIRAVNYALLGINRNIQQSIKSAKNISGAFTAEGVSKAGNSGLPGRTVKPASSARGTSQNRSYYISKNIVDLMAAEKGVEANIATLRAADKTLGALVNIKA
ncbi:hypothetical protein J7M07_03325 [bacterium]|nr:hypothetical protein [bacterium]